MSGLVVAGLLVGVGLAGVSSAVIWGAYRVVHGPGLQSDLRIERNTVMASLWFGVPIIVVGLLMLVGE